MTASFKQLVSILPRYQEKLRTEYDYCVSYGLHVNDLTVRMNARMDVDGLHVNDLTAMMNARMDVDGRMHGKLDSYIASFSGNICLAH